MSWLIWLVIGWWVFKLFNRLGNSSKNAKTGDGQKEQDPWSLNDAARSNEHDTVSGTGPFSDPAADKGKVPGTWSSPWDRSAAEQTGTTEQTGGGWASADTTTRPAGRAARPKVQQNSRKTRRGVFVGKHRGWRQPARKKDGKPMVKVRAGWFS